MEKTKQCEQCGAVITYQRGNKKYCDECARQRKLDRAKQSKQEAKLLHGPRLCKLCGAPILEGKRVYCDYCRTLTLEERNEVTERVQKKQRSCRFTIDELARLARQYRYPYNTYGRLKSCLELTGQLPRNEYRRDCKEMEAGHEQT